MPKELFKLQILFNIQIRVFFYYQDVNDGFPSMWWDDDASTLGLAATLPS